ncbi:MAG: heavy metal translocating P-type ATPase [bacterium]|nr:heavy metal translocating P-type ATPase [bacterium]
MKKRIQKIIIALILFILGLIINVDNIWINNTLFILSYILVGYDILKKAFRNITRGKVFDENFLMAVATIGAFFVGELEEAVAVMLFYQIGEVFQSYAVNKSRKSIASLMDIRPDYTNLLIGNEIQKVSPEDVEIGSTILVKPGEKIPIDGIVIDGDSSLDTKALTGEVIPKDVLVGEEVLSGCINLNGLLKIKTVQKFENSTVSKILDLVENASSRKSKSENFISKFAKYYTPIVVIIALFLATAVPFFTDKNYSSWIYRALSFLVVSCPCALVISIPLSFFSGIGSASKKGILIKGSNYLELLSKVSTVVFDKTGTLTKGVFKVQKINAIGISKDKLLSFATTAEAFSTHPIAKALKEEYKKDIDLSKVVKHEELAGFGIHAKIQEDDVLVGNDKLLTKEKIKFDKSDDIGTIIYVAVNKEFKGYIVISDEIKEDTYKAINLLKKSGIKKTVMLTGDKKEVGESVSYKLKLDSCYTELLPQDKVCKVEELMSQNDTLGKLAFVGDGINDAPVLALADIGIAMGGVGSDSAIEAADIVIMTDEISKIPSAIKLSKKTMLIVKENIIFAIAVKILVLLLTALGVSSMWQAVFADVGVSIIAILNSLRVLLSKK